MGTELPVRPRLAEKKVPWPRQGYPASGRKGHKWDDDVANLGASPQRLLTDDQLADQGARWHGSAPLGPLEERAFAQLWDYHNNGKNDGPYGMLWLLLDAETRELVRDEHDLLLMQKVAATFAQWLGTNCGRGFVEEARRLTYMEQKRLEPAVKKHRKLLEAIGELHTSDQTIAAEAKINSGKEPACQSTPGTPTSSQKQTSAK